LKLDNKPMLFLNTIFISKHQQQHNPVVGTLSVICYRYKKIVV